MTIAEALAQLPDETPVSVTVGAGQVTMGELRRAMTATKTTAALTTTEAAEEFGYSPGSWRQWAADGRIDGAWQDAEGGPWRLPYGACKAHRDALQQGALRQRGRLRGPWKKGATAPASRARAQSLQGERLKVVARGFATVGRKADDDAEPARARLAGPRRTHREPGGR